MIRVFNLLVLFTVILSCSDSFEKNEVLFFTKDSSFFTVLDKSGVVGEYKYPFVEDCIVDNAKYYSGDFLIEVATDYTHTNKKLYIIYSRTKAWNYLGTVRSSDYNVFDFVDSGFVYCKTNDKYMHNIYYYFEGDEQLLVMDGEMPVVSPEGNQMIFIRGFDLYNYSFTTKSVSNLTNYNLDQIEDVGRRIYLGLELEPRGKVVWINNQMIAFATNLKNINLLNVRSKQINVLETNRLVSPKVYLEERNLLICVTTFKNKSNLWGIVAYNIENGEEIVFIDEKYSCYDIVKINNDSFAFLAEIEGKIGIYKYELGTSSIQALSKMGDEYFGVFIKHDIR